MKKFFTMIGAALLIGSFTAQAESELVTVEVQDYDYNDIAKSFDSELVKNEDGSLTLTAFFNSGNPASFTFEVPERYGYADIKMTGNLDTSYEWPYLLTPEGDYMVCYAYAVDGSDEAPTAIYWPYVADTDSYSYVYRYSEEETYEYFGCICMTGTLEDDSYAPWYYLNFFFNMPEVSSVRSLETDSNAPVEFYNLNGMRVENPANGIFIRKQGNKTVKMVVK